MQRARRLKRLKIRTEKMNKWNGKSRSYRLVYYLCIAYEGSARRCGWTKKLTLWKKCNEKSQRSESGDLRSSSSQLLYTTTGALWPMQSENLAPVETVIRRILYFHEKNWRTRQKRGTISQNQMQIRRVKTAPLKFRCVGFSGWKRTISEFPHTIFDVCPQRWILKLSARERHLLPSSPSPWKSVSFPHFDRPPPSPAHLYFLYYVICIISFCVYVCDPLNAPFATHFSHPPFIPVRVLSVKVWRKLD